LFDGAGWFVGPAIALFLFALLIVFLDAQSTDLLLWTGHRVAGTEQGGIVFYQWHGQNYTIDVPGYGSSNAVSVYLDPADPAKARAGDAVNRTIVALPIGVPVAAGVALIAAGLTRRSRWARRQRRRSVPSTGYGYGLDSEFVTRHLQQQRRNRGNAP
jgi:hypothetical protein